MAYFDDPSEGTAPEPNSRWPIMLAGAAAGFAIVTAVWWFTRPAPVAREAPPAQVERRPVEPERAAPAAPAGAARTTPAPREPRARARSAPEPAAPAAVDTPAVVTPARELTVDVDVEGAMVFLDRKFLGTAPIRTSDVAEGAHQLNVSAQGFDGVARSIDVAESGPTAVTIRLKEVRLNEAVDVVHKHGVGSCQGRLTADLAGLKYVPQSGDDGFTVPLDAIASFDIDYMKKNLRIRNKGGKTWNFESPTGSADPLFVFHRDVSKARTRLASPTQ